MGVNVRQAILIVFLLNIVLVSSVFLYFELLRFNDNADIDSLKDELSSQRNENYMLSEKVNSINANILLVESKLKSSAKEQSNAVLGLVDETEYLRMRVDRTRREAESTANRISSLGVRDDELSDEIVERTSDFSGVINNALKSVVVVEGRVTYDKINYDGIIGTGFVISQDGYVVTNYHVVKISLVDRMGNVVITDLRDIRVRFKNGSTYNAVLVGVDRDNDIAVLKINGKFNALYFADSETVDVGDEVVAIGNPFGVEFTATQGIVSYVKRMFVDDGSTGSKAIYIQTDAAANPGNSGSPLLNKDGKVVGVINSGEGEVKQNSGVNFAVDSNTIRKAVDRIIG